jgi:hypothetical protein
LKSAVRDCGKTTTLSLVYRFAYNSKKSDNMTAASFFRYTNFGQTLLLDEVDNLGLMNDGIFRAALNSGHRKGGTIERVDRHVGVIAYNTFAPVTLSGIGTVPKPLARRSIVIQLQRDPDAPRTRKPYNDNDSVLAETVEKIKRHLSAALARCGLDHNPPMPHGLTGSQCDNWRVLLSIADACDPKVGQQARDIAAKMCRGLDEDASVILLEDVRDILDEHEKGQRAREIR